MGIKLKVLLCIIVLDLFYLAYGFHTLGQEQKRQANIIQVFKESEKRCLTAAMYHEARGESIKGIQAVASVIENRKNHPAFPVTYCEITQQHKQFSYTLSNKPVGDRLEAAVPASERKVYAEIAKTADMMVEGRFKPILPESTLWYTTKQIKNYWTKTKKVVTEIGKHRFYSDKEKL